MRTVLHSEHQSTYNSGLTQGKADVKELGFEAARDSFNAKYPAPYRFNSLSDYYFADGYSDGLVARTR